ncbi:hypothetical protein D0T66_10440 [Dysgonomonas sp. 25]|nr:hypothetical protein [Dysgonomonas sp. 25]
MTQAIIILALFMTIGLHGQVTIGSNQPPVAGALLDLKEDGTTKKGLGLPRVELQSYKKLKMGAAAEITGTLATEHAGLIVYNTLDQPECGTPTGLFVWEGAQWMQLSGEQVDLDELGSYEEDVQALKNLYNANPGNTLGWNLAADPSTFEGVTWTSICGEQRVAGLSVESKNLTSSTGIEKLYKLVTLLCSGNLLTSLDVSNNKDLRFLGFHANQLTTLDVSHNKVLIELSCSSNQLTSLDVSNNTILRTLNCHSNQLAGLDISHNTALESLSCDANLLTSLDLSNNIALGGLYCGANQLTNLDISNNVSLTRLMCQGNQLASLNVSNNTLLTTLWCYGNQLTTLDISNNMLLTDLECQNNWLPQSEVNKFKLHPNYCPNNWQPKVSSQYFPGTTTVDGSITAPTCP